MLTLRATRGTLIACAAAVLSLTGQLSFAAPARANGVYTGDYSTNKVTEFTTSATGALSPASGAPTIGTGASGGHGYQVAISPNGNGVYVAPGAADVSAFKPGADEELSPMSTNPLVASGSGTVAVAVSPNGKSLYSAGETGNTVSEFAIANDGSLSPATGAPVVATGHGPEAIAVAPDGAHVYVANTSDGTVSEYAAASDGGLSPASGAPTVSTGASSSPVALAVAPSGTELYVVLEGTGNVAAFQIGSGGALAPASDPPTAAAGANPTSVAVSPDGQHLYVGNSHSPGTVSEFQVSAAGTLSPATGAPTVATGGEPLAETISPDGQNLYVANAADFVSEFQISPSGALSPATGAPTASTGSGTYPSGIAITPDLGPAAAFAATPASAGSASTFSASASRAGSTPIANYAWAFGDGSTATGASPSHTYAHAGTYDVTLTLSDTDLCSTAGPFTGQTATCQLDPAAAISQTITVPAPVRPPPRTTTLTASLDNQRLTLTSPALTACQAPAGRLAVSLSAKTLSHGTRLRFSNASFYLDRGIRHTHKVKRRVRLHGKTRSRTVTVVTYAANGTVRKLPARLALSLKGLRPGAHTLKVVTTFKAHKTVTIERHGRRVKVRKTIAVTKTLRSRFIIC